MAGPSPEGQRGPERRETIRPFIKPGVARFVAAAHPNLEAKRIYDPHPPHLTTPQEQNALKMVIQEADPGDVDIGLVSRLSTGLREVGTQGKIQSGKSREDQLKEWGEGMVTFFQNLSTQAAPELKELARRRLGINVDEKDPNLLWEQAGNVWEKYLAKGSNIGQFFEDLMVGIPDWSEQSVKEMQKRIGLAMPFMSIFGDERMSVLVRDLSDAIVILGITKEKRKNLTDPLLHTLQEEFGTDIEREAFELLWASIKDNIPANSTTEPTENSPEDAHAHEPNTPPQEHQETQHYDSSPHAEEPTQRTQGSEQQATREDSQQTPRASHLAAPAARGGEDEERYGDARSTTSDRHERRTSGDSSDTNDGLSSSVAALVARSPDKPWLSSDVLLARKFGDNGFVLGAFDGMEKGGVYSTAIAKKLRSILAKQVKRYTQTPSVEIALRDILNVLEEVQPFTSRVRTGAEKELDMQKVPDRQKKEILDNIGTTGLIAITAQDGGNPVLAAINLGHSRLVSFDPSSGSVQALTADQTIAARGLRIKQISSEDEAFVHSERARLLRWVRQQNVDELEQAFQNQLMHGWSNQDEILRVFPLKKGHLYLALTNGIILNIPPSELPKVIQRAYHNAIRPDGSVEIEKVMEYVVREARRRMMRPEQYRLTLRGRSLPYIVSDDAGAGGFVFQAA